jgi:hypothetical protein
MGTVLRRTIHKQPVSRVVCGSTQFEKLFEKVKPLNAHSRLNSIFMTDNPEAITYGRSSWRFIYEVEPLKPQRRQSGWMLKVILYDERGVSRKECLKTVEAYAREYWLARRRPHFKDFQMGYRYEWLSPEVKIVGRWKLINEKQRIYQRIAGIGAGATLRARPAS